VQPRRGDWEFKW